LAARDGAGEPEVALSWCGGTWSREEVPRDRLAPASRGWFPSASWEEGGETNLKVVLFCGLMSSDDVATSSGW
jgi:hypothetical protein